jgi:hypothetical protein
VCAAAVEVVVAFPKTPSPKLVNSDAASSMLGRSPRLPLCRNVELSIRMSNLVTSPRLRACSDWISLVANRELFVQQNLVTAFYHLDVRQLDDSKYKL